MKLRKIAHSILNEADFKNIQSIIDGNQFVNGTANEESIIETGKHILFISPEGLKHIKERHSDRSKPGSIITGDLKDIITKTIQKSPSESSGGRVKWLDVKVGNVGEMGVAKATPEEVSDMTDYTMPDGRKETVKIKQGQRPKTDVFNVITAEIGEDSGKPVLSIITAFPGPNSIDGVEMPMDRNEFAKKGFYFIVNKKLDENIKLSKEILRMKKLAGLITESEIKQILKEGISVDDIVDYAYDNAPSNAEFYYIQGDDEDMMIDWLDTLVGKEIELENQEGEKYKAKFTEEDKNNYLEYLNNKS